MAKERLTSTQMYPLYERYKSSGQTIQDFCKASGINKHTFNYWRLKFIREEKKASSPTDFQQLIPPSFPVSNGIKLELPNGIQIAFPIDYPPSSLGKFIESLSC